MCIAGYCVNFSFNDVFELPKARRTYSRFEPIVTVTTQPDRRELTHDRLFAQSAVITADSTGESGVAGRGYWPIKTSETKAWSLREKF